MRTSLFYTSSCVLALGLPVVVVGAGGGEERGAPGRSWCVTDGGTAATQPAPDVPAQAGAARAAGAWEEVVRVLAPEESRLSATEAAELARAWRHLGRNAEVERVLAGALVRHSESEGLWTLWVDAALDRGHAAAALERIRQAPAAVRALPGLHLRAARAHFALGDLLGAAGVRRMPGGRAGQFVGPWLLVEARAGPHNFLCCGPDSALYHVRRALDGGVDDDDAHVLHARIWQQLGRPEVGLRILAGRSPLLLEEADEEVLGAYGELALAAGELSEYLRLVRARAERAPERRAEILFEGCMAAALRACQRGDDALYVQWLYRALGLRPNDPAVLLELADAEWSAGHHAAAVPLYRRVLALEPDHPHRQRMLQCLAAEVGGE